MVSIKCGLPIEIITIEGHYIITLKGFISFKYLLFVYICPLLFPHRSYSAYLISLPVHLCWWLCLTTVAMGDLAQLRKEVENLKEKIAVSISSLNYYI